jgi:hypothetical protein
MTRSVRHRDVQPEKRSRLAEVLVRAEALGATEDELAAMSDAWADPDLGYSDAEKLLLVAASDEALSEMIAAARDEFLFHTTTPDEAAEQAERDAWDAAVYAEAGEAANQVHGTVDAALAWVGDSRARAAAMLGAEAGLRGDDGRETLVEPLVALLDSE